MTLVKKNTEFMQDYAAFLIRVLESLEPLGPVDTKLRELLQSYRPEKGSIETYLHAMGFYADNKVLFSTDGYWGGFGAGPVGMKPSDKGLFRVRQQNAIDYAAARPVLATSRPKLRL